MGSEMCIRDSYRTASKLTLYCIYGIACFGLSFNKSNMIINSKYLTWIAFFGSFAMLVAAYGFEFLGGMSPCKMCLWQRWPHVAVIPIGILAFYSNSTVLLKVSGLIILLGAMIAFYHMGVEYKWWDGPSTCTSGTISGLTSSELLAKILKAPIVRCD